MSAQNKRLERFRRHWSIGVNDAEEFDRFKNRILSAVDATVGEFLLEHSGVVSQFGFQLGYRQPVRSHKGGIGVPDIFGGKSFANTIVYEALDSAAQIEDLAERLQHLFWALRTCSPKTLEGLVKSVKQAIDHSPTVHIRVAQRGRDVTLYPAGARELDAKVIDATLTWLVEHPATAKHFENALQIHFHKDKAKYRNLLDELRSALEKLARRLLGNRKALEKQKEPLLKWMQEKGAHKQTRNMLQTLLSHFAEYQNAAVKHGDEWKEPEIEFMIYLTGTFMYYLLDLANKNTADTAKTNG